MSRKEELPAEIQESREAALRKAVAETSEEDKTKLFPEFVKAQEAQGQKIETSDCQTPWQGLSLLDRLMWESTLADFARPRLFPEDIDEAVQRKLLEERVEARLAEITNALEVLNVQQEALGRMDCAKADAASSSLHSCQENASAETVSSQETEIPLEDQVDSEDLRPEDDVTFEDERWEEFRDPCEDDHFETRQALFDEEWIAQEYGTRDALSDYEEEATCSQDNTGAGYEA